jgi:hypothetical protein
MCCRSLQILFITLFLGCSGIPCSPPEYYAPEPDAPYTAEAVTVPTQEGHELAGTFTIPKKGNDLLPGVVLITGSSPQNVIVVHVIIPNTDCFVRLRTLFPDAVSLS